ncbi:prominin-2 [Gracilinanus agilis]|uniref:prominin-2 n=1 Tax=Gracilinanus agilis TaxID=191870 RepID=UPI001CFD9975|nr:prominin-2 [Gracilinanus agilis]
MRHPGSLGSVALLLGLELALCRGQLNTQYCGAQNQPEKLQFTRLGRGRWLDPEGRPPGSLAPLYRMVRGFLDVVQLNPFPEGLVRVALNEPSSVRTSEVVRYEAGYVVCAVIALLFLLIVPTVGFCFCCCRFRRRCGGRVKAEHKSIACERGSLMTFLLLITLLLLTGVVCAFITNQRTHDEVGPGVRAVPSVLHSLQGLVSDIPQVPSVNDVLQKLQGVPEANFSVMVQKDNSTFNTLPVLTAMETIDIIQDLKENIAKIPEEVKTLSEGFPSSGAADRWRQALAKAENNSRPYLHAIQKYERYRWIAGYVLSSVILLVVICNLLGLSLGLLGISAREDSSHTEVKGEAGAQFLMAGVGLSFLFSGPFILLIFATFLVGGNIQTLVCRSWESQELYQFADTPGNLPPSMNLSHLLGLKKDISIPSAYRQCKEGVPLWEVLQLNGSYDPEKHLDISKYIVQLQKEMRNFEMDIQNLDLLNEAAKRDLEAFGNSGIEKIDYPSFLAQVQKPLVKVDILKLVKELEKLGQAQSVSDLREQLKQEAQALQVHYQERIIPQQAHLVMLNQSVHFLSTSSSRLQLLALETLVSANSLKVDLPAQVEWIFRNESECFLNRETAYFTQYVDWATRMVTEHIATCQPLSAALDNGRVILCDHIANPWNAFWFCLAWCTFLLIPSIIFAIKTTKHFRPIRKRLSSTSSEETQLFHIPRVTSLKL